MLSRFRITPRRVLRFAAEAAVFLVIVLAVEWFLTRDAAHGPAPNLAGTLVEGGTFDPRALRGQSSVVYFWATWCPICQAQHSVLADVLRDKPGVTVAMRSGDAGTVRSYLAAEGVRWPTLNDPDGSISGRWGVSGVPAAFVLDRQGGIRFVTRGYTTQLGLRARLWLAGFW